MQQFSLTATAALAASLRLAETPAGRPDLLGNRVGGEVEGLADGFGLSHADDGANGVHSEISGRRGPAVPVA